MIRVAEDPHGRQRMRYSVLSMVLHWTIALLIFVQMGLGWWMNEGLPDHRLATLLAATAQKPARG